MPPGDLIVRGRRDNDLEACERLVRATHVRDGYPAWLGGSARSFLCHPGGEGRAGALLS